MNHESKNVPDADDPIHFSTSLAGSSELDETRRPDNRADGVNQVVSINQEDSLRINHLPNDLKN